MADDLGRNDPGRKILQFPSPKKTYAIDIILRGKRPGRVRAILGEHLIQMAAIVMRLELEQEERLDINLPAWWKK
jgi:hypothetical protein